MVVSAVADEGPEAMLEPAFATVWGAAAAETEKGGEQGLGLDVGGDRGDCMKARGAEIEKREYQQESGNESASEIMACL